MEVFDFNQEELLTFFAVLVRFSVLFAVLPIVGDRSVPGPLKVLLALCVTFALFPALVHQGQIHPAEAAKWGSQVGSIVTTIGSEVLVGLALGYTARLLFDAIHLGSNLAGNFMGFGMASTFDPHAESQTHVVAEIQMTIATLAFLALDGHHLMLKAALESYKIVGLGQGAMTQLMSQRLMFFTGQVIRFGIQLAAPIAISLFAVNVAFGVFSKALPQMNVMVLSMSVTALIGLLVMLMSVPEFQTVTSNILGRMEDWMQGTLLAMASR
ncbi:MAG: flagellar biosynthetic protein FliR [Methylotenera sp.]|nr:flagellar biosynthetic protein FliR [Oligoflexia bacterium]